jgi:CII-binding regulator of phage lambda lysogenization HflD
MKTDNESISKNGWAEYGRLVLNELERLNGSLEKDEKLITALSQQISLVQQEMEQHRNVDEKTFIALAGDIKDIRSELVKHLKEVNEVWSPKQMQQVKDEVYMQKNQMTKFLGIIVGIQIVVGLIITFADKIFG